MKRKGQNDAVTAKLLYTVLMKHGEVKYEDESLRVARLLESLVRMSKVPNREIEAQLGYSGGVLYRIFAGRISLKLTMILAILDAIKVEPLRFFQMAFQTEQEDTSEALLRLLREVRKHPEQPSPVPPVLSAEELDRRVEETLRRILAEKEPAPVSAAQAEPTKPTGESRRRSAGRPAGKR